MGMVERGRRDVCLVALWGLIVLIGSVAAEDRTLYVKPLRANFRASPTIETANVLMVLPRGTPIKAFEPEGEWHPVQLQDGRTGWLHTSVLTSARPQAPATVQRPQSPRLPAVRIGIVIDGPWERNEEVRALFAQEIRQLLHEEFEVRFPADKRLQADWTTAGVNAAMDRLLADPQVDVIVALGVLASNDAGRRVALPKPVFAPFVIDATLQGIPRQGEASGVRNLSYISFPSNLPRNVQAFRDVVPFRRLTFLVTRGIHEGIPELLGNIFREVQELGIQIAIVPVDTTVDTALAALPTDTQAVYVVPLLQLIPGEFDRLVAGLIARHLPSFSLWGRSEVERGLLLSRSLDTDFSRLARRVALNLQRTLLGEEPGTFPVTFTRRERLTINMATARALGLFPKWDILTQAELLHPESTEVSRQLSLAMAVREAVAANLDLAAADRFVAAGKEHIREARAALLPQVDAALRGQIIDDDRAAASLGAQAERTLTGSLTLSQLLYAEPTWANLRIQRHLQSGREETRRRTRLDVVLDAAVGYLHVLRAKTVQRIRRENLDVTRTNLELARVRRAIGVARAAEVLRWENQTANDRRHVITAFAQRQQAEIGLNRILHRPLEETFTTTDPALDDPELMTSFARIFPYVDNPRYFEVFRDFMVGEGLLAAPELRQVQAQIAAQERNLRSAQRAFWSPTVSLRGNLTGRMAEGGAGTDARLGANLPETLSLELPEADDINWEVGVQAALPLFTSGARAARRDQAREELARLQVEREAAVERIAARIRVTLYAAGASFVNIELAQDAAAAARENLELVSDAYGRGSVSILDLLDAQNEALVANLNAANAVYEYLIDLMEVQRAVGQFDFFVTARGRKAWFERLDAFFRTRGLPPKTP